MPESTSEHTFVPQLFLFDERNQRFVTGESPVEAWRRRHDIVLVLFLLFALCIGLLFCSLALADRDIQKRGAPAIARVTDKLMSGDTVEPASFTLVYQFPIGQGGVSRTITGREDVSQGIFDRTKVNQTVNILYDPLDTSISYLKETVRPGPKFRFRLVWGVGCGLVIARLMSSKTKAIRIARGTRIMGTISSLSTRIDHSGDSPCEMVKVHYSFYSPEGTRVDRVEEKATSGTNKGTLPRPVSANDTVMLLYVNGRTFEAL